MYGPDRKLLGTMKLSPQRNGHVGLVLDFDPQYRFDPRYQKQDKPPVVCAAPEMFGDYEPPDYDVPDDADNY
jgi:hypothetical protein